MSVRLEDVKSSADRNRFERIAEDLHGRNPFFVPPFPGSIAKFLKPGSAFQRLHGEIHAFTAWRDERPVGRITAVVNRTHNGRYGDRVGFFGFFACEDNAETSGALFERASGVLRDRGLTSMRGPYNPSINDECGLLTQGFNTSPCIGLTWNPAYYESLVIAAGLRPVRTLYGFDLPLHDLRMPERLTRLAARVASRSKTRLRPINLGSLEEDLAVFREVYNDTLERNWGFVPISMEELLDAAGDMRAIADPEMILIAEKDGEPAGVALSLPNFNELLIFLKGTPHWLRLPHILWLMKTRRIQTARQIVYGILPKFRDRGLHAWLLHEQFRCAKERFRSAELGWIEENNTEILENSRMVGGVQARTWKIFEKPV